MITIEYPKNMVAGYTGAPSILEIDATPRERYNHFAQATENPIENGAVLSDHTIITPDFISFDCVISNTPMTALRDIDYRGGEGITAGLFTAYLLKDRVKSAYDTLLALRDNAVPVRIVTGWGPEYDSMVVEIFSVDRQASTGNSLVFQLGLKRVAYAFATTVDAQNKPKPDPVEDRGKTKDGRGNQPAEVKSGPKETELKDQAQDIGPFKRIVGPLYQ